LKDFFYFYLKNNNNLDFGLKVKIKNFQRQVKIEMSRPYQTKIVKKKLNLWLETKVIN